jgi:hypothetical protein
MHESWRICINNKDTVRGYYFTRDEAEEVLKTLWGRWGVCLAWIEHYENGKWVEVPSHD